MQYLEKENEVKFASYKVLRLPEVKSITGLSRTAIYDRIANQTFPKQFSLGGRAVGWNEQSIFNWVKERIASSKEVA